MKGYSTLQTPDGREKPYYYAPRESEGGESLVANVGRKAWALGWVTDVDEDLKGAYVKPQSRQDGPEDPQLQRYGDKRLDRVVRSKSPRAILPARLRRRFRGEERAGVRDGGDTGRQEG